MRCPWCDGALEQGSLFCPICGREVDIIQEELDNKDELHNCLRCSGKMESLGKQKIQLGKHGFFLGDLSHLLSGALDVEIFKCNKCGKYEFFEPEEN